MVRVAAAVVLVLILVLGASVPEGEDRRCECGPIDLVGAAQRGFPVFLGTVTSVEALDGVFVGGLRKPIGKNRTIVDFDVSRSWRTWLPPRMTLHTHSDTLQCDSFPFEEGRTYLLLAFPNSPLNQRSRQLAWPEPGTWGAPYCGVYEGAEAMAHARRLNRAFPGRP